MQDITLNKSATTIQALFRGVYYRTRILPSILKVDALISKINKYAENSNRTIDFFKVVEYHQMMSIKRYKDMFVARVVRAKLLKEIEDNKRSE